jgi:hypothetical protein
MADNTATGSGLKRPIGIYILAVLFIIAPLGNILISFAGAGISNWYEPSIFMAFVESIPGFEWTWLGLLFLTGVLLFRPHKLSWSFAIGTLLLILCLNVYRMYSAEENSITPDYLKVFSILALFCTLGVLVIAFYFRFPYLDRRANWIKNIERFDLLTEVKFDQTLSKTESVSMTGCKILTSTRSSLKTGDQLEVQFPEIYSKSVKCEVVENKDSSLRLEFSPGQEEFSLKLKSWIKTKTGA